MRLGNVTQRRPSVHDLDQTEGENLALTNDVSRPRRASAIGSKLGEQS